MRGMGVPFPKAYWTFTVQFAMNQPRMMRRIPRIKLTGGKTNLGR
jgi:hypothetical protein